MESGWETANQCVEKIRERTDLTPRTALILGSGLGELARRVTSPQAVSYQELPGFPVSTVSGHEGRFVLGFLEGEPVIVMQGRVHFYEGYSMEQVVLPVRVMHALGAKRLILTNAAGGISPALSPGDLMLLTDHLSFLVSSPLIGPNEPRFGPRFPDMSEAYSKRLRALCQEAALEAGVPLREGVYLQVKGPQYETPAEIRAFAALGADAVGMSTACEAIAAGHLGMEVCGVSCITNLAAGLSKKPLSHEEVGETARKTAQSFQSLLCALLKKLGKEERD